MLTGDAAAPEPTRPTRLNVAFGRYLVLNATFSRSPEVT